MKKTDTFRYLLIYFIIFMLSIPCIAFSSVVPNISGLDGTVNLLEDSINGDVNYTLFNNGTSEITTIVVSTNTFAYPGYDDWGVPYDYTVFIDIDGWYTTQFSKEQWIHGFADIMQVQLTDVIPFEELFGSDLYANVYYTYWGEWGYGLGNGTHTGFGMANAAPASEFVAFDKDGNLVDRSNASGQVPEPSAIALMGLGLLGFGVTRRKRQK